MLSTVFNWIIVSLLVCGSEAQSSSVLLAAGCESFESNVKYSPIDMPGQPRTKEDTATECQQRCASVSGCAHFSFWPDGGCHLQDGSSSAQEDPEAIAGSPTSYNDFEFNVKYSPVDMIGQTRTEEKTVTKCQERCASVSGCAHFSFWRDGGCHLQDSHAKKEKAPHVVAGPQTCSRTWRPLQKSNGSPAFGMCYEPGSEYALGGRLRVSLRECLDFCSSKANCKYATYDHVSKLSCIAYSKCDPDNMAHPFRDLTTGEPEKWLTYEVSGSSRRLSASRAGAAILV